MTTPSCPSPALRKWRMNSSKKRGKTDLWWETLLMTRSSWNPVSQTYIKCLLMLWFASLMISGKNELTKLHTDKKKQFGPLVRWLKVNFGECFTAWIHVKVWLKKGGRNIPCFLFRLWEYLLNQCWGLASLSTSRGWFWTHSGSRSRNWGRLWMTFTFIWTLQPGWAEERKFQVTKYELFYHQISNLFFKGLAGFGQGDYYPYVYYKINIDMVGPVSSLN